MEFCTLKSSNCTVARGVGLLADWFSFFWSLSPFFVIDTHKSAPQNSSIDFLSHRRGGIVLKADDNSKYSWITRDHIRTI